MVYLTPHFYPSQSGMSRVEIQTLGMIIFSLYNPQNRLEALFLRLCHPQSTRFVYLDTLRSRLRNCHMLQSILFFVSSYNFELCGLGYISLYFSLCRPIYFHDYLDIVLTYFVLLWFYLTPHRYSLLAGSEQSEDLNTWVLHVL